METLWTLHVENFAGIERADIDVSPLTLFVGDNNSGKSYLLALIYGLMRFNNALSDLCEDSAEYQACAEWIKAAFGEMRGNEQVEKPFDEHAYTIFENLWNRILQDNQKSILESIFSASLSAGKISVKLSQKLGRTLRIGSDANDDVMGVHFSDNGFPYRGYDFKKHSAEDDIKYIISKILEITITMYFTFDIFFIPTSRTGFLLTYPALAKDAFSRAYSRSQNRNSDLSLTLPFTDFLGNLTTINKKNLSESRQSVVDFLERNIIHGKILVSNDLPLPEFYYLPENMKTSLPMYLSSDVVKEVAPLILMLQYKDVEALFIEEPEMSLHLELQQMMARTLIKVVNAGTPVLAATHSDTILQHVNNMVKLNNLPEARRQTLIKRFKFDPDDPISADKISMYQFDVQDNGRTVVRKLSCGKYGFEIPTFYAPLEALLQQTQDTEPEAEEYED